MFRILLILLSFTPKCKTTWTFSSFTSAQLALDCFSHRGQFRYQLKETLSGMSTLARYYIIVVVILSLSLTPKTFASGNHSFHIFFLSFSTAVGIKPSENVCWINKWTERQMEGYVKLWLLKTTKATEMYMSWKLSAPKVRPDSSKNYEELVRNAEELLKGSKISWWGSCLPSYLT